MGETRLAFIELWNKCSQTRIAIELLAESSENVVFFYHFVGQQEHTFSHCSKKTVVPFVL